MWINSRRRRLVNHKLALQNAHIVSQREAISKHNEDLSRNNQELSDLNQEKNTLMNIVAHDLKSPLNRISGLASIIEMDTSLSGKQKDYMKLIRESTRSGLDLITDLLDVNALEEVKGAPDKKEVDIAELLDERVKGMQVTANNKGIRVNLRVDADHKVQTDYNYISRIVDNLLSNAIKFSSKGSEVDVAARVNNNSMILSVKDTGPGFMEEDKPFLFQKFKKLSARPTGGESSNGLGLAIVKTLVDRLKGDIRLETARGKGSEFIITLPL
jgi:signal transduction histidine kinase